MAADGSAPLLGIEVVDSARMVVSSRAVKRDLCDYDNGLEVEGPNGKGKADEGTLDSLPSLNGRDLGLVFLRIQVEGSH